MCTFKRSKPLNLVLSTLKTERQLVHFPYIDQWCDIACAAGNKTIHELGRCETDRSVTDHAEICQIPVSGWSINASLSASVLCLMI